MQIGTINAAWVRRSLALSLIDGAANPSKNGPYWQTVNEAEKVIRETPADKPEDIATKLWIALWHMIDPPKFEDIAAVQSRSLEYFASREADLDWDCRLVISALRSLAPATDAITDTQRWQVARHCLDLAERAYRGLEQAVAARSDTDQPSVEDGRMIDQAFRAREACEAGLMRLPAPGLPELRWKLERLLDGDGAGAALPWDVEHLKPILADIDRLLPR